MKNRSRCEKDKSSVDVSVAASRTGPSLGKSVVKKGHHGEDYRQRQVRGRYGVCRICSTAAYSAAPSATASSRASTPPPPWKSQAWSVADQQDIPARTA